MKDEPEEKEENIYDGQVLNPKQLEKFNKKDRE